MDEKTQGNQLKSWVEQRDTLLSEISVLRNNKEKLIKSNKEISDSYTKILDEINQSKGRLEELKNKEKELPLLISKEIASLQSNKTCLETEITNLEKIVKILTSQKEGLETSVSFLTETFKSVNERVGLLEKVVGHVTEVSDKNISTIESLVSSVKKSMQDLIDTNKVVVDKTNIVINELPKVFLEVQRKSLEREVIKKIKK